MRELIDQDRNKQKLQVLESIHIKMNQAKAINRKGGEIDGSWDKVIDHYSAKKHLKAGKKPGRKSQAFRIQRQERRLHQDSWEGSRELLDWFLWILPLLIGQFRCHVIALCFDVPLCSSPFVPFWICLSLFVSFSFSPLMRAEALEVQRIPIMYFLIFIFFLLASKDCIMNHQLISESARIMSLKNATTLQ